MSDLDETSKDRLVSVAKGVVGACPIIGPLVGEAIGILIPNQRLDRVVEFLGALEVEVGELGGRLENLERSLRSSEGLDILEEGLVQASRSVATERKERVARLVARSLTGEEIKYEESRKLLNIFRDLTDPELLWLVYYSMSPTLGPGQASDFAAKHPEVLDPVSRETGAPQEQIDRAALQDSYKNTLVRFGLIEPRRNSHVITSLGRLMVRYTEGIRANEGESE